MLRTNLPTVADVTAAAQRLRGMAIHTPVLESALLNAFAGERVLLKAESLQRGGAYKFRGAYNRLIQLTAEEKTRGVVAWSSGNHAVAVAIAGELLGVVTTVVMPKDTPRAKSQRVINAGATIVSYDRCADNREEIAKAICRTTGAILVPSFDDPDIIAGQGTAALELIEQAKARGIELSTLIVPCGGGGLAAGTVLACELAAPRARVFIVEPAGFDDTALSLAQSRRVRIEIVNQASLCDALLVPSPGELTFKILRRGLSGAAACSDSEVREAVGFGFRELKLVLEPSGAIALAAILSRRFPGELGSTGVILTGGGVDSDLFSNLIQAPGD